MDCDSRLSDHNGASLRLEASACALAPAPPHDATLRDRTALPHLSRAKRSSSSSTRFRDACSGQLDAPPRRAYGRDTAETSKLKQGRGSREAGQTERCRAPWSPTR
eukprot:795155-Rhodomonas_salina.2